MKTNKYILIAISMMFAFAACSDSVTSDEPDEEEPEISELFEGQWRVDPNEGSLAVGPNENDLSWWSIDAEGVEARSCFFDDTYVFNADGSFQNNMGAETWVEAWQEGVDADGCGAPVAPHDGSTVGEWTVSDTQLTVSGNGVFMGLAKVHNGGEDGNPEDNTITYEYRLSNGNNTLELTISGWLGGTPEATWYFRFVRA